MGRRMLTGWRSGIACNLVDFPAISRYTYPQKEVNLMKKRDILPLLYQLASPVALMVLGLVLLISPDSASVLISRLLGWAVTVVLVGYAVFTMLNWPEKRGKRLLLLFAGFTASHLLLHSPLLLARNIGRFLGVLIALRGLRDLFLARDRGHGQMLAMLTAVVGIVLVLLPMTASRILFSICGGVLFALGLAMLVDRLKDRRYLDDGGDPNIIDAL